MRVCGTFQTPLRARQLYWGWSTFAPPPTARSWRDRLERFARETVEGRCAVSGSLAGMFPAMVGAAAKRRHSHRARLLALPPNKSEWSHFTRLRFAGN